MISEKDYLVQSLFERENLEEMTLDELKGFSDQYPFSSIIQFLYTCKLKTVYHLDFPEAVTKTALFFRDPYWLDYQLNDDRDKGLFRWEQYDIKVEGGEENKPVEQIEQIEELEAVEEIEQVEELEQVEEIKVVERDKETDDIEEDISIPIEPYHTVDYFASQGIKLTTEEEKDELAKKVKSFTAWLKTMKRLQPEPENISIKDPALFSEPKGASHTISEAVVTEAMAEVYLKQGLKEKAIEVYDKLSLQNPANRHIFASRILKIKEQ